jgi:hypothetical protein
MLPSALEEALPGRTTASADRQMLRSSGVDFQQTKPDQRLDRACAYDFVGVKASCDKTPSDRSSFGNFGLQVSAAIDRRAGRT